MADKEITIEELAEFIQRQLTITYDVFDENRTEDSEYNSASWARGRVDAFLQVMGIVDKDREAMWLAEWVRVVTGQGFTSDEE